MVSHLSGQFLTLKSKYTNRYLFKDTTLHEPEDICSPRTLIPCYQIYTKHVFVSFELFFSFFT